MNGKKNNIMKDAVSRPLKASKKGLFSKVRLEFKLELTKDFKHSD